MTSTNPFLRHAAQREQAQRADRGTDRPVPPPSAPSLPRNAHAAAPALTPLQAHYLKKSLVQLEIREELAKLARPDALALLGPPFRSSHAAQSTDLPLVRHLFHKFVLTFPFFAAAPPHFFSDKVQLFVERLVERNLIVIDDGNDGTAGVSTMIAKMGKYLAMLVSAGITVSDVREDIVRIREHDHERLARLDTQMLAARGRADSHIDVAGVRRTIERGRLRTKTRDEFLLVSTHGSETVYVARTSKEFEQLHQILLAQFPSEDVPDMPPRDMSATTVNGTLQATDDDGWTDMTAVTPSQLVRERNRHTLRAYLRSVLAIPAVADSEALRSFLTDEPTTLTAADKTDIEMRKRADALRNAEHQAFAQRTTTRVTELQEHLGAFKQQLLEPDGLSRIFATVRRCPHVNELPPEYAVLVDWATVSMASGLFTMFIGSDSSSSTFAQLKYMHGAMPYFMVRSILKISNPLAMMRALLDLFLMQPFGQKSLMQRMFSGRWQEEVAEMKTLTKNILDKLPDPIWARKVDAYLALPQEQQRLFREQARAQHSKDVLVVVLESPLGGDLSAAQRAQLARATTAYQALTRQRHRAQQRGRPEPIPSSRDEWLLEDLHVYLNQCAAIHDKEQLISLVFDNATTELVKDIITIFYAPLAQVYRAANVGDALGDLQVFITDLIKTIEENQALSATNTEQTVTAFVNLVQRHQQTFYHFVHQVHAKGSGLFEDLVAWVERFVQYVRDPRETDAQGLGFVDMGRCLPHDPAARARVLHEADVAVQYAYQLKLKRELRRRHRMAHAAVSGAANMQREEDLFIQGMSEHLGFSGSLNDEIDELSDDSDEASMWDEEDARRAGSLEFDDSDSSDDEPEDPDGYKYAAAAKLAKPRPPRSEPLTPPNPDVLRSILPSFIAQLLPKLASS